MDKILLEVCKVSKSYKKKIVIEDISLKVHQGEIVGLLGQNGSGKSTIIKILMGLIKPSQGHVSYFGQDFSQYKNTLLPKIGYVHETETFYGHLTVYENLTLFKTKEIQNPKYIEELLSDFDLGEALNEKVKFLNFASKKKLALVRAFLYQPTVVILDEPFNDLDRITRKQISEMLLKYSRKKNIGLVISSHILSDLENLCDTLSVVHKGRLLKTIKKDFLKSYEGSYYVINVDDIFKTSQILNGAGYSTVLNHENLLMVAGTDFNIKNFLKFIYDHNLSCHEIYPYVLSLETYLKRLIRNEMSS